MKGQNLNKAGYYNPEACNLVDFLEIINQKLEDRLVPHASEVQNNIPIYNISALKNIVENSELKKELMAEWAWVLRESSGAIVLRNAYSETSPIDEATELYE